MPRHTTTPVAGGTGDGSSCAGEIGTGEGITVLVVDDHDVVRKGLRFYLSAHPEITIVGEAGDLETALKATSATEPDVVLLDWSLRGPKEADRAVLLKAICPGAAVVAMGSQPDSRRAALRAGADAFVCKSDPPSELLGVLGKLRGRGHKPCIRGS